MNSGSNSTCSSPSLAVFARVVELTKIFSHPIPMYENKMGVLLTETVDEIFLYFCISSSLCHSALQINNIFLKLCKFFCVDMCFSYGRISGSMTAGWPVKACLHAVLWDSTHSVMTAIHWSGVAYARHCFYCLQLQSTHFLHFLSTYWMLLKTSSHDRHPVVATLQ